MLIYNLLLAAAAAGIILGKVRHGKLIFCIFDGLLLFAAAACRCHVGHDYNSYGSFYIDCMSMTEEELSHLRMEKGYVMLSKLTADYIVPYHTIFIVMGLIIIVPVMIYIYKYSELPYLSVFGFLTLGVYFNSLNFIRQIIAAVIVMWGLRYIEKGSFFRFAVIVVFASCFHVSALIMLAFWFILRIDITPAVLAVYSAVSVLIFIFSWDIVSFVTKYAYRTYDPADSIYMQLGLPPYCTIYFGIIFLAAFLLRKPLKEKNKYSSVMINCMFFAVLFEFIGMKHSIISRLSLYFLVPASLELIPMIGEVLPDRIASFFKGNKKKQAVSKAAAVFLSAAFCIGMYEYLLSVDYNGVMPYHTIFAERAGIQYEK